MNNVYIGIGSNIGDREENCRKALELLSGKEGIEVVKTSSLHETKPVGGPPQDDYLNGVVEVRTDRAPEELLLELKGIEKEMGRELPVQPNMPRIIDLDILLFGDKVVNTPELVVPHPRMHERYFVLKGMVEIAPDVVHPTEKLTIKELYDKVNNACT